MDPLYTETEAAAILRLAPKTLRNLRHLGGGPVFEKVGGAVRYSQKAIEEYRASRRFERTPMPARGRAS